MWKERKQQQQQKVFLCSLNCRARVSVHRLIQNAYKSIASTNNDNDINHGHSFWFVYTSNVKEYTHIHIAYICCWVWLLQAHIRIQNAQNPDAVPIRLIRYMHWQDSLWPSSLILCAHYRIKLQQMIIILIKLFTWNRSLLFLLWYHSHSHIHTRAFTRTYTDTFFLLAIIDYCYYYYYYINLCIYICLAFVP